MNEYFTKDFFTDLFDLKFKNFVTQRLIKILFLLSIALSGVGALTLLINGLSSGNVGNALLALIFAPIFFFVYVLAARVSLELVLVVFRISDNIQAIGLKQGAIALQPVVEVTPPPAPPAPPAPESPKAPGNDLPGEQA